MAENEVSVKLTVNEKQAIAAINKLNKSLKATGRNATGSISKMDAAMASFTGNLASGIALKALDGLKNGIAAVTREAVEFETAFAEINTILPKSERNSEKLRKTLVKLSGQFGTSQAKQAKSYYQIISSGAATGAEAAKLLEQANVLATGGLGDVTNSVDLLTDIINVYGSENLNAKDAADSLFTTVRLGKTTINELTSSLGQVLPSAQKLGISLDDVGAALATMTTQGLTTAQRTTQLQSIFTAVFKNSASAAKNFGKEIGDAFSIKALRDKGLVKFLEDLQVATKGNEDTLSALLSRKEALNGMFALTGSGAESLGKNMESMTKKAGAAKDALDEIQGTASKQWDIALQKTINIGTKMTAPIVSATTKALQGYNSVLTVVEKAGEAELERSNNVKLARREVLDIERLIAKARTMGASDKIIESMKTRLALAQQIESTLVGGPENIDPDKPDAPEKKDPNQDPRVIKELAVFDILRKLAAEKKLAEEEQKLLLSETVGEDREVELERLAEIELAKINIIKKFKLSEAGLIKESGKQKEQIERINAETSLAIVKKTTDLKIKEREREAKAQKANNAIKLGITSNFLSAGAALAKSGSSEMKAIQIAQATMSTYAGATHALADPNPLVPYPLKVAQAASIVVMGLANIAKITSAGSYANGGFIGGSSYAGDRLQANVNSGEAVLNVPQQREFMNIANGKGQDSGGRNNDAIMAALSQPIIIQVDNREIARAVRSSAQEGFSFA